MTQSPNPYDSGGGFGPGEPPVYREEMGEPRLSVMSVLSIICSIPFCCIPAMGIVGATLGAVSLAKINSSQGRVYGRAAAVVGLLLGIITTAVWAYVGFGMAQGYTFYKKQMAPAVERFLLDAGRNDIKGARAALSPSGETDLTDDRIRDFAYSLEQHAGPVHAVSADLGRVVEAFSTVMQGRKRGGNMNVRDSAPVPVAVESASGVLLAWGLFDDSGLSAQHAQVSDLLISLPDGTSIVLREDGPARDLAHGLGIKPTPLDSAPPDWKGWSPAAPGAKDGAAPTHDGRAPPPPQGAPKPPPA